jgi:membrane-associated phospholipid phosphatase
MRRAIACVSGCLMMLAQPSVADAQSLPTEVALTEHAPAALAIDPYLSASISLTLSAGLFASEARKDTWASGPCRWCDDDGAGHDDLPLVDAWARAALRWQKPKWADRASHATAFVVGPGLAYGGLALAGASGAAPDAGWQSSRAGEDALILTETALVSIALNQLVKAVVKRERPDVHAARVAGLHRRANLDDHESFYSGHTNLVFALGAASTTIAAMRGYDGTPWLGLASAGVSVLTGYLRIAADRHYALDVLVGALLGSALGVSLPLLLHPAR